MGNCVSCGARIRWARSPSGKPMPIDPEPCEDGNLIVEGTTARVASKQSPPGIRWRTHFVTCPNAAQHRRHA